MTTTLTRHHHVADRTTELVLDELRQSVHSIVLYGSVARGKHTEESDVDILVIADSPTEPDRFSERLCDIETASGALFHSYCSVHREDVDSARRHAYLVHQGRVESGGRALRRRYLRRNPQQGYRGRCNERQSYGRVRARLQLDMSDEALEASVATRSQGLLRSTVDRAYYAAYHAAIAILSHQGVRPPKSHRGLVSVFGSEIANSGIVPSSLGRTLALLHRDRMQSNYEARAQVTEETADRAVTSARQFVEAVRAAIEKG